MKLIKTRDFLIIVCLGLVAFILGCIFDKSVSETLFLNSGLEDAGHIISNYALEFYFIPFITSFFICLFGFAKCKNKLFKIAGIICAIISVGLVAKFNYDQYKEFEFIYNEIFRLVHNIVLVSFNVIISFVIAYFYFYKHYELNKIFRVAISCCAFAVVTLAVQTILKYSFSRPRPFYIFGGHEDEFRNVWEANFFAAFKDKTLSSFPSGHAMCTAGVGAFFIMYATLFNNFNNDKCRLIIFYIGAFIAFCTALFRITAGMHFLTDVSMGLIISYTSLYFGCNYYPNLFDKFIGFINKEKNK